jgi:ankyrin repeat protein
LPADFAKKALLTAIRVNNERLANVILSSYQITKDDLIEGKILSAAISNNWNADIIKTICKKSQELGYINFKTSYNDSGYYGVAPIHLAVLSNNKEAFDIICDNGGDVNLRTGRNYFRPNSPLPGAMLDADLQESLLNIERIRRRLNFLASNVPKSLTGYIFSQTPAHLAAALGHNEMIKKLARSGANIDQPAYMRTLNTNGKGLYGIGNEVIIPTIVVRPIHEAVAAGHVPTVLDLIESGVSLIKKHHLEPELDWLAVIFNRVGVLKSLIEKRKEQGNEISDKRLRNLAYYAMMEDNNNDFNHSYIIEFFAREGILLPNTIDDNSTINRNSPHNKRKFFNRLKSKLSDLSNIVSGLSPATQKIYDKAKYFELIATMITNIAVEDVKELSDESQKNLQDLKAKIYATLIKTYDFSTEESDKDLQISAISNNNKFFEFELSISEKIHKIAQALKNYAGDSTKFSAQENGIVNFLTKLESREEIEKITTETKTNFELKKKILNEKKSFVKKALKYAAKENKEEIAKMILENSDLSDKSFIDGELIYSAIANNWDSKFVDDLCKKAQELGFLNFKSSYSNDKYYGMAPIHYAVLKGNEEALQIIHDNGGDINLRTGRSFLHPKSKYPVNLAPRRHFNSISLIDPLYIVGYSLDKLSGIASLAGGYFMSQSPAHLAASVGKDSMITKLKELGSDIDSPAYLQIVNKNSRGFRNLDSTPFIRPRLCIRPIHEAVASGHVLAVKSLIQAGASLESKNSLEPELDFTATNFNRAEILQLIIDEKKGKANEITFDRLDDLLIHVLLYNKLYDNRDVMECLIKNGAIVLNYSVNLHERNTDLYVAAKEFNIIASIIVQNAVKDSAVLTQKSQDSLNILERKIYKNLLNSYNLRKETLYEDFGTIRRDVSFRKISQALKDILIFKEFEDVKKNSSHRVFPETTNSSANSKISISFEEDKMNDFLAKLENRESTKELLRTTELRPSNSSEPTSSTSLRSSQILPEEIIRN